jgi:hypothetical protein
MIPRTSNDMRIVEDRHSSMHRVSYLFTIVDDDGLVLCIVPSKGRKQTFLHSKAELARSKIKENGGWITRQEKK